MPIGFPRGDGGGNTLLSANGGPLIAQTRMAVQDDSFDGADDQLSIISSPLENRIITAMSQLPYDIFTAARSNEKFVPFDTYPAAAGQVGDPPCPDFANGSGFIFLGDSSGDIHKASSMEPDAVFTIIPEPNGGATNITTLWAQSGYICGTDGNSGDLWYTDDNGVTWNSTAGWGDIDHGGYRPFVSPDGSIAMVSNAAGNLWFVNDPTAGTGGVVGDFNIGFIPGTGAWNADGTTFLFSRQGAGTPGDIWITQSPFAAATLLPASGNPFIADANSLLAVNAIVHDPVNSGFHLFGSSSQAARVAFLPESDLTSAIQGVYATGESNVSIPSQRQPGAWDYVNNVPIVIGSNMRCMIGIGG